MADSTSKYWEKRAREREAHWTEKCQREIEQEMARYYAAALREIEKDILALYARFAQDNALSMTFAGKTLYRASRKQVLSGFESRNAQKEGDGQ